MAARRDDAKKSDAIIVLGAAQFDGRPSKILAARLDHAIDLYRRGIAPFVVVTGGNQPGDRFTEARRGAAYLHEHGVPESAILREIDESHIVAVARGGRAVLEERSPDARRARVRSVSLRTHRGHRPRSRSARGDIADAHESDQGSRGNGAGSSPRRCGSRPGASSDTDASTDTATGREARSGTRYTVRSVAPTSIVSRRCPIRGWCNRQHDRFWPCYWGFESSPPSPVQAHRLPRSSSGLGRQVLILVTRVQIPYGVPPEGTIRSEPPLGPIFFSLHTFFSRSHNYGRR